MIRVYSNALLPLSIGTMNAMHSLHIRTMGFWIGFACGTIGLFALALLRILFPIIGWIAAPFFWPAQFFAELLTDGKAPTFMIIILYILTGVFYGFCGEEIERWRRRKIRKSPLPV